MPRFFIKNESIETCDGATVARIYGDDAFHIARSLRMAVGDSITLSDEDGKEYDATLIQIRDEVATVSLGEGRPCQSESPVHITLYMAYPKGDKLETVIQKAVELGATRIVPFESSRCIKRPKADKIEEKTRRLSKIAAEAAKQCGRARLPEVSKPLSFSQMLDEASTAELSLFCYEGEGTRSIRALLSECRTPRTIAVIVGCEGGFSVEEAAQAKGRGLLMTGLGHRILRCETAPDYALSAISYQFELQN